MTALFVSPHLDDAVFSAGATIARLVREGVAVTVATVFTRSVPHPTGFALACQLDKGVSPDVDYMALRREEDRAACERLGATPVWLDLPEAPHRGYENAAALFGPRRDDDPVETVIAALAPVVADAARVFVPQGIGGHVDHLMVRDAVAALNVRDRVLAWVDQPYAHRKGNAPPGTHEVSADDLARKLDAAAAYATQLGFQFGGEAAMRATLLAAARHREGHVSIGSRAERRTAAAPCTRADDELETVRLMEAFVVPDTAPPATLKERRASAGAARARAMGPSAEELARAIAAYEAALPDGEHFALDISALDTLAMPVRLDAFMSPAIGIVHGFGYGATAEEARVGALGELAEEVFLTRALVADAGEEGSFAQMVARHGSEGVLDPLTLCLPAGSPYAADMTLRWVKVHRWPYGAPDGPDAWVPREFVAITEGGHRAGAPHAPEPLVVPITNGLGAGLSPEQALSHGLLELLQRDGNTVRFRAMDHGVVIDLDGVDDPGIRSLVVRLGEHGIRPVAKLAATDFGLTNLYVVDGGEDEPAFPLQATACGEASHPSAGRALRKALLEFAAARCRKALMHGPLEPIRALAPDGYMERTLASLDIAGEEHRALDEMLAWVDRSAAELREMLRETVFAERRRVAFADLPSVPDEVVRDPADRLAELTSRLTEAGMPIYYYDATPPGSGVHVVKAIVPGLECETMSYHRIGARGVARLMEDDTGLAGLGAPPDGAKPVRLTDAAQEALGGPAWLDVAGIDARVGALYPLYREPTSHAVQLARGAR
ncbi:YcaO-like family protein [Acuticoccus sp.]|uniref:YcaO-like family protein n=1 Tax=Acuticoccus sp. TaxID=1904378 RepID=UPI003B5209F1